MKSVLVITLLAVTAWTATAIVTTGIYRDPYGGKTGPLEDIAGETDIKFGITEELDRMRDGNKLVLMGNEGVYVPLRKSPNYKPQNVQKILNRIGNIKKSDENSAEKYLYLITIGSDSKYKRYIYSDSNQNLYAKL